MAKADRSGYRNSIRIDQSARAAPSALKTAAFSSNKHRQRPAARLLEGLNANRNLKRAATLGYLDVIARSGLGARSGRRGIRCRTGRPSPPARTRPCARSGPRRALVPGQHRPSDAIGWSMCCSIHGSIDLTSGSILEIDLCPCLSGQNLSFPVFSRLFSTCRSFVFVARGDGAFQF